MLWGSHAHHRSAHRRDLHTSLPPGRRTTGRPADDRPGSTPAAARAGFRRLRIELQRPPPIHLRPTLTPGAQRPPASKNHPTGRIAGLLRPPMIHNSTRLNRHAVAGAHTHILQHPPPSSKPETLAQTHDNTVYADYSAPRSAVRLVAESATGKVPTRHILYRVLSACR